MPDHNQSDYSPTFPTARMSRTVVQFTGRSGVGKTTLIERIIVLASALERRVGTIKHTHHTGPFIPGAGDSGRFLRAGAIESILAAKGVALVESTGDTISWQAPEQLLERMPAEVDLLVIEGFREWRGVARIGVHRGPAASTDLPRDIVALVSDGQAAAPGISHFSFSELPDILRFLDTIGRP